MSDSQNSAHKVLDYLITKAAVSGKVKSSKVRISYKDMLSDIGRETTSDVDLIISFELSWDEKLES